MGIWWIDGIGVLAAVGYAFLTYLIVRDIYNPLVSFSITQRESIHLNFDMMNNSKVQVEVFGKLWAKINGEFFVFRDKGFYDDGKHWILQPLTHGYGHFYLTYLKNKKGVNLLDFVNRNSIPSITFNMEIKYRRIPMNKWFRKLLKGRWRYLSPQNFVYNFNTNEFWLNV